MSKKFIFVHEPTKIGKTQRYVIANEVWQSQKVEIPTLAMLTLLTQNASLGMTKRYVIALCAFCVSKDERSGTRQSQVAMSLRSVCKTLWQSQKDRDSHGQSRTSLGMTQHYVIANEVWQSQPYKKPSNVFGKGVSRRIYTAKKDTPA